MKKLGYILLLVLLSFKPDRINTTYVAMKAIDIKSKFIVPYEVKRASLLSVMMSYEKYKPNNYKLFGQNLIGYGHHNIEGYKHISQKMAYNLMVEDFESNYKMLSEIKNEEQRMLLAALAFNIGINKVISARIYKLSVEGCTNDLFKKEYVKFSHINGKFHRGLYSRRINEFKSVFDD